MAETDLEKRVRDLLAEHKPGEATTVVIRELGPEILGFLSGVLGDADGDDVFSTFSVQLWRTLDSFKWACALRTWCYMLARQQISRFCGKERRHGKGRVPISELEEVLAAVRKTYSTLAADHRRSTLARLRNELSTEDRTLLILRVDREMSFDDIALAFADNPETVREVELKRSSTRLRKRFQLLKDRLIARARETYVDP
jgi:RNA polymerase sigma-70 factor (ECF subfamily)